MRSAAVALSLLLSLTGVAHAQELDRPAFGERTNSLENSVPSGTAVPGVLSLGLREAVDRAVKNNLAAILGTQVEQAADARRLQDRAEYFPKIDAFIAGQQQQVNLAAFGFGGFPGIRQVIGPFELFDARASLSQSILDYERRHNLRQSTETQRAAAFTNADIRELVALTAVDLYFQAVSSQSRVAATEAQLMRARTLHDRAVDLKAAGVVPGIDVLRADVEQRTVEQRGRCGGESPVSHMDLVAEPDSVHPVQRYRPPRGHSEGTERVRHELGLRSQLHDPMDAAGVIGVVMREPNPLQFP